MRVLLLLILASIATTAFSQGRLNSQIKAILADSANNFRNISGSFKDYLLDSTFHSKITLEGTTENELEFYDGKGNYYAGITNGATPEMGSKLFNEWTDKLDKILGKTYRRKDQLPVRDFESFHIQGYVYEKGRMMVILTRSREIFDLSKEEIKLGFYIKAPVNSPGKW